MGFFVCFESDVKYHENIRIYRWTIDKHIYDRKINKERIVETKSPIYVMHKQKWQKLHVH